MRPSCFRPFFCGIFALLLCIVNAQESTVPTAVNTTTATSTAAATSSSTASTLAETTKNDRIVPTISPTAAPKSNKKYFSTADLPICRSRSPEFNECLRELLEKSLQRVRNGDAELNIPVIDPFQLNRTTFQYTNGGARGRIILRDALIYGFSKSQLKKVDFKVSDGHTKFRMNTIVPEVRIEGNYKAEFLLNTVQLRPRGEFNISLIDVDIDLTSDGDFYEADGHRFVRLTKFDADPKVGDFKLLATGVFPDPTLNELAVNIVNQYWRQIFRVFLPETRQYWAPLLLRQINEVMSVSPYDVFVNDS